MKLVKYDAAVYNNAGYANSAPSVQKVYLAADIDPLLPQWTTAKPTVPGWYWFKDNLGLIDVFNLRALNSGGELVWYHSLGDYEHVDLMNGEWAGPVTPPMGGK